MFDEVVLVRVVEDVLVQVRWLYEEACSVLECARGECVVFVCLLVVFLIDGFELVCVLAVWGGCVHGVAVVGEGVDPVVLGRRWL